MRKIVVIVLCLTALFAVQACNTNKTPKPEGMSKGQLDSMSIAVGLYFYDQIANGLVVPEINYDLLFKTMRKLSAGKEVDFTITEAGEVYQNYMMKKQTLISELNQRKGAEFLAKNKTKEGVIELPSGLQYKIIEEGTGIQPSSPTDTVVVHYTGTIIDGTKFDSSYDRGEPATFPLNGVINGWTEGFQLLKEGTKAILYIPSDLAYGPEQRTAEITPYSTLIFEVELIKVLQTVETKN